MKKVLVIGLLVVVSLLVLGSGIALAANGPSGPAPNSGDGIPDGSGLEAPNGPNGTEIGVNGPAPNSGDCESNGSGF